MNRSGLENKDAKILRNLNIYTDRVFETRRSCIVVVDKQNYETVIIDIAVPEKFKLKDKELEKKVVIWDYVFEKDKWKG